MIAASRPLRFVGLAMMIWVGARVAILLPGVEALRATPAALRVLLPLPGVAVAARPQRLAAARPVAPAIVAVRHRPAIAGPAEAAARPFTAATDDPIYSPQEQLILASLLQPRRRRAPGPTLRPGFDAAMAAGARARPSRWSGDGYLFLRGGGGGALGPGGQIGGGQAFARLSYRLDDAGGLAAVARLSRATGAHQTEAAVGLAVTPVPRLPVRLTVERRVAIDAGGRDAWAAFAAAGVDGRRIGPLRLDGYAQAGLVGASRRDAFVDGAARLGREAGRLTVGAGAWGAAQPGAARLDVGPQAALRLPVGAVGATMALDWRMRVAGDARPGNGVALTLAAGF